MLDSLIQTIENALAQQAENPTVSIENAHLAFEKFLSLLESGQVRAAYPDENNVWHCNPLVKQLILYGFKLGRLTESIEHDYQFCDKHNLWPNMQKLAERSIRIVPGGSTVRRGACIKNGVTMMPPAYVNIGGFVDEGSMVDSHVTIGSCAQIGKHCHISAATQIGGVLEPVGALSVIVEDNCFVGGNCGIYESAHIHAGAVIASGTIITRSTPVFDLVKNEIIRAVDGVIHIPENAVVVSGARTIKTDFAHQYGLSAYAPLIIKYRDDKTETSIALEKLLH